MISYRANYKIKPSFARTDKMYLFCVLFNHGMFRLILVASSGDSHDTKYQNRSHYSFWYLVSWESPEDTKYQNRSHYSFWYLVSWESPEDGH
jgi:hypothetical protein